jgi:cyclopropane fatty-acyl-phospholipid synthase-like methyltransferase
MQFLDGLEPDTHPSAALAGAPDTGLRPFSLGALARGARIYEFAEFYAAKNRLLRYDDRQDYLNYGYWCDGDATANPSASLVLAVARAAGIARGDVVLNLGSGLGQPDVDIARAFAPARCIGVNLHHGQVAYANARAQAAGLDHVVEHRVADAQALATALAGERPTRAVAIETLAEMPRLAEVLGGTFAALQPGGTLGFCDVVATEAAGRGRVARAVGHTLTRTTSALYGDTWRTSADYAAALEAAGFEDVALTSIGPRVYTPTWRFSRSRLAAVRRLPRGRSAAIFALLNLGALAALHTLGQVDYVIGSARKPL